MNHNQHHAEEINIEYFHFLKSIHSFLINLLTGDLLQSKTLKLTIQKLENEKKILPQTKAIMSKFIDLIKVNDSKEIAKMD